MLSNLFQKKENEEYKEKYNSLLSAYTDLEETYHKDIQEISHNYIEYINYSKNTKSFKIFDILLNKNKKINVEFDTGYKLFNFNYNSEITVKEMLLDFLFRTNSIMILNTNNIVFMYHSFILNNDRNLSRPLEEVLSKRDMKPKIKVLDAGNIKG